ncbi:hypothetical protein ONS95_002995 [Cadophora gregata]|uniref:uncharacterized protein n=1 Tax=Cadophora gregata TaxID=51156 RepID=UPI0026DD9FB4|nr:uncharacterized protein ONS95_002995 [Cadophora gregata]KAK0108173.1 hypothetical protein ONS95_002995 [Cadophora gregata]
MTRKLPQFPRQNGAIYKAEQVHDPDLSAQAYLWAAIANFYHGQSEVAQGYLDKADGLKKYLKCSANQRVLGLWAQYGVLTRSADRRMEGYNKRFQTGKVHLGRQRALCTETASTTGSQKYNLLKVKPSNNVNDLPDIDTDGEVMGEETDSETDTETDEEAEVVEA